MMEIRVSSSSSCISERDGQSGVRILLTNDDGIYAPGLAAMQRELCRLGEV